MSEPLSSTSSSEDEKPEYLPSTPSWPDETAELVLDAAVRPHQPIEPQLGGE